MTLFRIVPWTGVFVLAVCTGTTQSGAQGTSASPTAGKPLLTLQMPALPDPVRVALNPATTALLVLDYVEPICNSQPKCKSQMLPAMTPFMERARKAGLVVAYGTREPPIPQRSDLAVQRGWPIQKPQRANGIFAFERT
jgi:hypothetical protein